MSATRALAGSGGAVQRAMPVVPVNRDDRGAELVRERLPPRACPIGNANLTRAAIEKAVDDGARAAARADDDRGPRVGSPVRLLLQDIAREAVNVVVRPRQRAIRLHDDAADGADAPREIIDLVNDRQRAFLVRNGQVTPSEAKWRERTERRLEIIRFDGQRNIGSGQPVLLE